jgi:F1F0 ATPase subunit 2
MDEPLALGLAVVAGLLLGAIFFGGLWWTLRKRLQSPQPVRWLLGSLVLRTGVVLTGFYLVGDGDWEQLLACLIGFVAARTLVTRLAGPPVEPPSAMQEATHAPESR